MLFNTIVPAKRSTKLTTQGRHSSLCNWILDFLTGRPQVVRVGNNTSATLILNTGAPQGCVLSHLLYSLFTHDCTARHNSNTIIQFADYTTVVGLITDNDETAYREEVTDLALWCQDNNLSFNVIKTKEMIVDYRKKRTEHAPILIHISNKLSRSKHTMTVMKRARQNLFPFRRLKRFGMGPQILKKCYSCTIERILKKLHHCLVSKLLGLRPQDTTEGSANGPVNHWGQASCHPGPLYQAVSEEGPENGQRLQPAES